MTIRFLQTIKEHHSFHRVLKLSLRRRTTPSSRWVVKPQETNRVATLSLTSLNLCRLRKRYASIATSCQDRTRIWLRCRPLDRRHTTQRSLEICTNCLWWAQVRASAQSNERRNSLLIPRSKRICQAQVSMTYKKSLLLMTHWTWAWLHSFRKALDERLHWAHCMTRAMKCLWVATKQSHLLHLNRCLNRKGWLRRTLAQAHTSGQTNARSLPGNWGKPSCIWTKGWIGIRSLLIQMQSKTCSLELLKSSKISLEKLSRSQAVRKSPKRLSLSLTLVMARQLLRLQPKSISSCCRVVRADHALSCLQNRSSQSQLRAWMQILTTIIFP